MQDFVCKVQSIRYFPGRGNAFVQMTLRPVQNTVVSVLVRSFYASRSCRASRFPIRRVSPPLRLRSRSR